MAKASKQPHVVSKTEHLNTNPSPVQEDRVIGLTLTLITPLQIKSSRFRVWGGGFGFGPYFIS